MPHTTRPLVLARHGVVSSPHYLASTAGTSVLQAGGSAVDAAIAACATLGVVYPHMTGVGGDALWLIHDAATGRVRALNGSGRAVARASRAYFRAQGYDAVPARGPLAAITVPGAVDSWCEAHENFGRLPLASVLAAAISYARDGYPVCAGLARCLGDVAQVLGAYEHTLRTFLPDDRPPRMGEVARLPRLAATLEAVAEKGRDGFYSGPVAEEMAAAVQRAGGLLDIGDLGSHRGEWVDPISTTYRGHTCFQHPPNSQGLAHLVILNILEGYDLRSMGETSADYLHVIVEATKLAFAARDRYVTDPRFSDVPIEWLLSKQHAGELRDQIDRDSASPREAPTEVDGDTTCVVAADAEGNAVSVIQSLYQEFGSAFVAGETGVVLQNRGIFFSLDERHVNRLEPGKRTSHTLMPGMMHRDGKPYLVHGAMGGEGQAQTLAAVATRVVDFDQDIQYAIDRPRWVYGRTWKEPTTNVRVESRVPPAVLSALRTRGHPVVAVDEWDETMGHAQGIVIDQGQGVLMAGADPRSDGIALGW